ncbi:hypothetical protein [Chryseobacterium artocarpi]|uniref:hypothetical protein n=1 Tax=Chryseobacterium artocarpi TaxID=1414727 RepID=UPI003F3551D2
MGSIGLMYKDKGFWLAKCVAQFAMHYIRLELEKPQYLFTQKEDLLEDLSDNINGYCSGYVGLNWDNVIEPAEEQIMAEVLRNVKHALENKGTEISADELMSISTEDHTLQYIFDQPFPVSEMVRVISILIQMVEGSWDSTNYEMDLKWRYKNKSRTNP